MNDADDAWRWKIGARDSAILTRLAEGVRGLSRLARTSHDLLAVGEAWEALESLRDGGEVEVSVGLDVGFRRQEREDGRLYEEGLFVCLRVHEEEIVLNELHTSYSSEYGSDHFTKEYARFGPSGGFDEYSADNWLGMLRSVLAEEDVALNASRDHI